MTTNLNEFLAQLATKPVKQQAFDVMVLLRTITPDKVLQLTRDKQFLEWVRSPEVVQFMNESPNRVPFQKEMTEMFPDYGNAPKGYPLGK